MMGYIKQLAFMMPYKQAKILFKLFTDLESLGLLWVKNKYKGNEDKIKEFINDMFRC